MPDPIPVAPAPAAAPATPPPPQPPAAPAATPEAPRKIDIASMANLLTGNLKPAEDKPKEPDKPAAGAPPPPPKAREERPVRVPKKETPREERPAVPKRETPAKPGAASAPPPATPAPAAATAETDEEFESKLPEEERLLLDDAREAERRMGDKYKGQGGKMTAFLRETAKKEAAVKAGDIDAAEFRTWYESNRPKIGAADFRAIERARLTDEVRKEFQPKLEEESHARWAETQAPTIKRQGDALWAKLTTTVLPDELAAVVATAIKDVADPAERARRIQAVQEEHKMEFEVAETVIKQATADLEEFHRLLTFNPATGKPLKARNTDLQSEEGRWHANIAAMAHNLCDEFRGAGGTELQRDGKWFATWREWNEIPEDKRGAWWTFSNDEIADRVVLRAKSVATAEIARRNEYLTKMGFNRQRAAAAAPATPLLPPGAPPAPRGAPVPGDNAPPKTWGARLAQQLG